MRGEFKRENAPNVENAYIKILFNFLIHHTPVYAIVLDQCVESSSLKTSQQVIREFVFFVRGAMNTSKS